VSRNKIAAIVLILSAGIVASYLIVKKAERKPDLTKSGLAEEQEEVLISKNPIKWLSRKVAELGDLVSGDKSNDFEQISLPQNVDFENINLTEFVAKSSFTQMKGLDQSGKDPFSIDPNDPANKEFLEKAMASINNPSSLFNFSVNDNDLKISGDNSKEAKARYLDAIGKIMLAYINNDYKNPMATLQKFATNFDVSGIKRIVDTYSKTLSSVMDTKTPSDYLEIHKEYIVFLKKAKAVYSAVVDYDKDPIKATLSAQLITQILEEDYAIKEEYANKLLANLQSKN